MDGELAVGSKFGEFDLVELVGRGHRSLVYRADHPSLGRDIALKIVEASDAALLEAAATTGKVSHPGLVAVYGHGHVDEQAWLAMRLITGAELNAWLRHTPLTLVDVSSIVRQVACGLDALHEAGLAHGDVKPQNILITAAAGRPDRFHAHLIDPVPPDSEFLTLDYAAPERLERAPATAASDQYSLATVAYELIVGTVPFPGETPPETAEAHMHSGPPPSLWGSDAVSDRISATALDTVFRAGLARDSAHRYASCSGLAAALDIAMKTTDGADAAMSDERRPDSLSQRRESLRKLFASTPGRAQTTAPPPARVPGSNGPADEAEERLGRNTGAVAGDDAPQWGAREERPDWASATQDSPPIRFDRGIDLRMRALREAVDRGDGPERIAQLARLLGQPDEPESDYH